MHLNDYSSHCFGCVAWVTAATTGSKFRRAVLKTPYFRPRLCDFLSFWSVILWSWLISQPYVCSILGDKCSFKTGMIYSFNWSTRFISCTWTLSPYSNLWSLLCSSLYQGIYMETVLIYDNDHTQISILDVYYLFVYWYCSK